MTNTAYPENVGDVVVDSEGEGWLSDGADGWNVGPIPWT